jgi:hypothetical protein
MYALVYVTRYLEVFLDLNRLGYNGVMKLVYLFSSFAIIYYVAKYRHSTDKCAPPSIITKISKISKNAYYDVMARGDISPRARTPTALALREAGTALQHTGASSIM